MPNSTGAATSRAATPLHAWKWKRFALWGICALITAWAGLLVWKWPFTEKSVITSLEHTSHRSVQMRVFHPTFMPLGYVADNLTFINSTAKSDEATFTIRQLTIVARWSDLLLLRKRIDRATITGLKVRHAPPRIPASERVSGSSGPPRFSEIGLLQLEDAAFAFPSRDDDSDPFTITLQRLSIERVTLKSPSHFQTRALFSAPNSTIDSEGQLGPWNWVDPGKTPLTGAFTVRQADLSVFGGIAGNFTGSGRFQGPLSRVACTGKVDVPHFQVGDGNHPAQLSTTFAATVNGLNGDTKLDHVEAKLNQSVIEAQGVVEANTELPGKETSLHLAVESGHIEDFLRLFTRQNPSMTGIVHIHAELTLPPGPMRFLEKIRLQGDFNITNGRFTKLQTQTKIDRLSKSAEGMSKGEQQADSSTQFSDWTGHVIANRGTATVTQSVVRAPGSAAQISGTYNLLNKTLHLDGILRTTGNLSDTTSGMKATLLKVITPFWKHDSATVVPFTITGTTHTPHFALSMSNPKKRGPDRLPPTP